MDQTRRRHLDQSNRRGDIAKDSSFHVWERHRCPLHPATLRQRLECQLGQFASHLLPNPGTTSCIQLRADAVGYAVNQLLSTAATSEQCKPNQFQVGLYPFIVNTSIPTSL